LRKLKQQNIIWASGLSAGHALLLAGEFKIMGWGNLRHVLNSQEKGAPVDWCRVSPLPVTGGTYLLMKKAPHPNAARLFIEWQFSPQGLATYEKLTGYGNAYPGSGTRLAKTLGGISTVYRNEEIVIKVAEMHLDEKYSQILGITPD
jgi:ABC-type Fe3+ transport system substrate-binding protein